MIVRQENGDRATRYQVVMLERLRILPDLRRMRSKGEPEANEIRLREVPSVGIKGCRTKVRARGRESRHSSRRGT